MKKLIFALALATSPIALASCAGLGVGTVTQPVGQSTAVDEKALVAAETLYNVPAQAYVTLDARGQLSADTKAKVKPLMLQAYEALKAARTAYKLGNVAGFQDHVALLTSLTAKVNSLLPHGSS